jgi:hypothetical protein
MKNRFFCTAAAYVSGDKGDFFHSENFCLKIIMERVTDHTSWRDAVSPLSTCRASLPLATPSARFVYLLVSLLVDCVVTQNAGFMPSNLLPQPPGHLFEF